MTQDTQARLARLYNRRTAYELVAIRDDRRILIAYSQGRSRHSILAACRNRGQQVIDALGISASDLLMFAKRASDGCTIGPWSIRFSGRTEREAILTGELEYVGDLAKAKVAA
jgi:hypothetical protein